VVESNAVVVTQCRLFFVDRGLELDFLMYSFGLETDIENGERSFFPLSSSSPYTVKVLEPTVEYSCLVFYKMYNIEQTRYLESDITHSPTIAERSRTSTSSQFKISKGRPKP
jgi:hypothetical protein